MTYDETEPTFTSIQPTENCLKDQKILKEIENYNKNYLRLRFSSQDLQQMEINGFAGYKEWVSDNFKYFKGNFLHDTLRVCDLKTLIIRSLSKFIDPVAKECVQDAKYFTLNSIMMLKFHQEFICGFNETQIECKKTFLEFSWNFLQGKTVLLLVLLIFNAILFFLLNLKTF